MCLNLDGSMIVYLTRTPTLAAHDSDDDCNAAADHCVSVPIRGRKRSLHTGPLSNGMAASRRLDIDKC